MDRSSRKQIAATEASSSKAETAVGTSKQVADAELAKVNRSLALLEIELVVCCQQIDDNLRRREDLVQQICLLISTFERNLGYYDQAENARRKLEETLSADDAGLEENWRDVHGIVDSVHELQEDVIRAERQVGYIRSVCEVIEPQLKLRKVENETIHARLCEKLGKIVRSRQAAIVRRKQLLVSKKSMKNGK